MNMDDESVMDDLDALAAVLEDDDAGADEHAGDEEEPGSNAQESDRDDEELDAEDDADEDAEDDEDEEDEDRELDEKSRSAMQRRIDTLTRKSKSEAERAAKLEADLEAAEQKLAQVSTSMPKYTSVQEVDERMEKLADQWIPKLESLVDDAPNTVTDEVTGESRHNLVSVNGKSYPVREVKDMLRELRTELRTLPKERSRVAELEKRNAEGRKILPDAWRRGTVADQTRRELLRDVPELSGLGDSLVAVAVLGKLALKQHEERKVARKQRPPRTAPGLKSSAKTQTKAPKGRDVHLTGLDPELAKLAQDLDIT